jgi:hypothetical protein
MEIDHIPAKPPVQGFENAAVRANREISKDPVLKL